jgi:hexosaminidase
MKTHLSKTFPVILITLLIIMSTNCSAPEKKTLTEVSGIIPLPVSMHVLSGQFILTPETNIIYPPGNEELKKIAEYLNQLVFKSAGFNINLSDSKNPGKNSVQLLTGEFPDIGKEGYILKSSRKGIQISANEPNGVFYGVITLWQLFPTNNTGNSITIPSVQITDMPRFKWRGASLDVGRHFFDTDFIKKYIDILALHKMNVFHWHLTDDQGWRIEIKKYPLLTEIGAWRDETVIGHPWRDRDKGPVKYDGIRHGGFYTQKEIKEIIEYAADRYVTIVPEIEMPGHAQAAIASYPELGCTGEKVKVRTIWGISPYIYNVDDNTFKFLEDVLSEVMDLFPSEYIHIGGDEALKDQWKASEKIQKQMKDLGLKDEQELQSYFIKRIEEFINSKGRKLIGWDEILEGGLAPNATVMSWRGIQGGIEATRQGHDVVMTPTTYCYLDYYQSENTDQEPLAIGGYLPLDTVYNYEPVHAQLSADEAKHILGVQGNVWTEFIASTEYLEYMLLPRLTAIAELNWTPKEMKNPEDFKKRLETQIERYKLMGWNYRPLE